MGKLGEEKLLFMAVDSLSPDDKRHADFLPLQPWQVRQQLADFDSLAHDVGRYATRTALLASSTWSMHIPASSIAYEDDMWAASRPEPQQAPDAPWTKGRAQLCLTDGAGRISHDLVLQVPWVSSGRLLGKGWGVGGRCWATC